MRVFGHPVHAIVVEFPIGLLVTAFVWDAGAWLGLEPRLAIAGYYSELTGLVLGALAVATGVLELLSPALSAELRPKVLRHAGASLAAASLFVVAFALRRKAGADATPTTVVLALEALGAATLGVTGFLGGELVFRHGVGSVEAERRSRRGSSAGSA